MWFFPVSWWAHCSYLIDLTHCGTAMSALPFCSPVSHFLGRSLDLTLVNGKTSLQENLDDFLPFLKNSSALLPHVRMPSMHFRCSGASPFSTAICITAWLMAGLCLHPWHHPLQVCWTPLQGKAICGLHSEAVLGLHGKVWQQRWSS